MLVRAGLDSNANCFSSCAVQRIKLRWQREHSPDVKLAVALERAVAGSASSRTENHALTLGSRPFGSIGDRRTSLGSSDTFD